ncbi:hypothetical protein SHIRM173S_06024 [Streptomyces hirsutus]
MTVPVPVSEVALREYGPAVSVPLGAEAGRALAASGILESATRIPAGKGTGCCGRAAGSAPCARPAVR